MVKPEIGLSTLFCLGEPFKKMIERILEVDATHIEIVDEGLHELDKKKVRILNELAASYSLKYTVHAPFADINIASPSKPLLNAMLKRLKKSIRYARALNCHVWVFHPGLKTGISMFYPGMEWIRNVKTAQLLFKFARDYGVETVIENMPEPFSFIMRSVEDFKKFYSEVEEDIGLVLDVGHAHIHRQVETFLTTFTDKIVHVHAHDNYGKMDQHLGIGYGTIDWKRVADLLKGMSYNKIVIIESVDHIKESILRLKQLVT
jgi:sugar phosphate isomerase/epimerase